MSEVGADDSPRMVPEVPAARALDMKSLPSVKLRTFGGDHAAYREWRREAEAAQLLYQIPDERMSTLIFLSLEPGAGKPRDLLAHFELKHIASAKGLADIWDVLDQEYDLPSYRKADRAASRYEYCRRQTSQPMGEYVMMLKTARREMEREDPGTVLSDVSFARHMLRRSGLSAQDQRSVLAACGAKWSGPDIEAALKLLFHDVHLQDRYKKQFSQSHPAANKDRWKKGKSSGVFEQEEVPKSEPTEEVTEEQTVGDEPDDVGDQDEDSSDTEELLETLYTKTKAHFHRKQGQDHNKSVADKKKNTRCADCKELGHWRGDPECKMVKSGQVPVRAPSTPGASSGTQAKKSVMWNTVCVMSATQGRQKRRNELVVIETDGAENLIAIADMGSRTIGTQTDITGEIVPLHDSIPGDVDVDHLEGYTNKQLQAWLRERSWSTKGNKKELVDRVIHAITVDGPTDGSAPACEHLVVRAGANGTHAWKKCQQCGKIVWKMNKATKEVQQAFTATVDNFDVSAHDNLLEPVENGDVLDHAKVSEPVEKGDVLDHAKVTESVENGDVSAHEVYIAKAGKDIVGYMVPDTGCKKSVAGVKWHREMRKRLRREGLQPLPVTQDTGFRFGDGREVKSSKSWRYPCAIQGKVFCLEVAEINEACPPLLSIDAMRSLGCDLNLSSSTACLNKVGVTGAPLEAADSGHPLLKLWELDGKIKGRFPLEYQVDKSGLTSSECLVVHESEESRGCEYDLIHKYLDTHVIPRTSTRTNLGGSVRSLCVGAYTRRGVGITKGTKSFGPVVGLTRTWLQSEQPSARFTTLSLSQMQEGDMLKVHKDGNTGTSWVRAMGNYEGGKLWIAGSGHVEAPVELQPLPEGCPPKGRLVDLSAAWFCLDATQYHGVCSVCKGTRYSISAYICRDPHKLSSVHWHDLARQGFAVQGVKEQLSLKPREKRRLAQKVATLPKGSASCRMTLQQVFAFSSLLASVVCGALGWKHVQPLTEETGYPLTEPAGRAAVAQQVWSTCADVLVVQLSIDHDSSVIDLAHSVCRWQRARGSHVLVVAERSHPCWNPEDVPWTETLHGLEHFGLHDACLRAATTLQPLAQVFRSTTRSLPDCLKLGLQKTGRWLRNTSHSILAVTDETWLPGSSSSSTAQPNFDHMRSAIDQAEMVPLRDAAASRSSEWEDTRLDVAPTTPQDMEFDMGKEESERQVKRARVSERLEPLEPIAEEDPPYVEDETGQVEPSLVDDRTNEELMEGQWRDWIRRSMTTAEVDLPDEIDGMPSRVREVLKSIPQNIKSECKLVHHQLGHPGRATMIRMAKLAQKGPLYIRFLKHWQCPLCLRRAPPQKLGSVSGTAKATEFNVELCVDLKYVRDVVGRTHTLLNMIDTATRYSQLVRIKDRSATTVAKKTVTTWVRPFGAPVLVKHDLGKEFGLAFQQELNRCGTLCGTAALESPHQNSLVERHGGILGEIMEVLIDTHQISAVEDVKLACSMACAAKNARPSSTGYSASQRVFGTNLRWAGSVLEARERGYPSGVDLELSRDPVAARASVLRSSAEEALARMDADSRWRRCLADARVPDRGEYEPGAQVYFWQRQKSARPQRGRAMRTLDRWLGPAVVLAKDVRRGIDRTSQDVNTIRGNYWVSHGTRLYLVSPEQMRPATVEERLAQGVYDEAKLRLQELLGSEGTVPFSDERWPEEGIELTAIGAEQERTARSQNNTPRHSELEPDAEPARAVPEDNGEMEVQPEQPVTGEMEENEVLALELKPGGKELNPRLFNEAEWKLFQEADLDQLNAHLKTGAFEVIPPEEAEGIRNGPERSYILPVPTRLLRVNKGDKDHVKAKSRLILPGHVCGSESGVRTDSPTAPQMSLYFLLSMAVQRSWDVTSFDVSNAFLSGQPTSRRLYVQPPKDCAHLGLTSKHLLKVLKGVFGLPESPRLWWLEIRRMLLESGWEEHPELVATFLLFELKPEKTLVGILSLHVDDGIWSGIGEHYESSQQKLRDMVSSRTTLKEEKGSVMQLLGRRIEKGPDWISVD
eukprot:2650902-Amphidinium_carterae.1